MDAIVHIETPKRSWEHRQLLEETLYSLPGVTAVRADGQAKLTSVLFDDDMCDIGVIADEARACGFPPRRIVFRRLS